MQKVLLLCFLTFSLFAKEFVREYVYNVGDNDSKNTARAASLAEVKRLLLEEVGVHLYSKLEIKKVLDNSGYKKDVHSTLQSITAGITKTTIMSEYFDGTVFKMTAKISIDVEEFHQQLKELIDKNDVVRELEQVSQENKVIMQTKYQLENELKKEKNTIKELRAQLGMIQNNELHKLKKELEIKNSQLKLLDNKIQYQENSSKLQTNELVQKANAMYYSKDYEKSLALYEIAHELGYESRYLFYNIANINYKLQRFNNAILNYKKYLQNDQDNLEAYNNLAICYMQTSQHGPAVKSFKKALKIDPNNASVYNNLGILYYQKDDVKKAEFYFLKAKELGSRDATNNLYLLKN